MSHSPSWITATFIEDCLQNIKVNKIKTIRSAVGAGDNFAGEVFRIVCDVTEDKINSEKSFILKTLPDNPNRIDYVNGLEAFEREVEMYSKTLPGMAKYLSKFPPEKRQPIWATCYSAQFTSPEHILLDDLSVEGFRPPIREKGLDMDHLTSTLKSLARFHSLSVLLQEESPSSMDWYDHHGLCTKIGAKFHENQATNGLKFIAENIKDWPNSEVYREKLIALKGNMMNKFRETLKPKDKEFCVLNHGDLWLSNVMFSKQGSDLQSILIDFQLPYYSSPVVDLHFFLLTSPVSEVRLTGLQELLEIYHRSLFDSLISLGYQKPIITLKDLKEEFFRRDFLRFYYIVTDWPMALVQDGDDYDFDALIKEEQSVSCKASKVYKNPVYTQVLKTLLPVFVDEGVI